jgi:hypothetical protein
VLRCAVTSVRAAGLSYRGALRFDGHLPPILDTIPDGKPIPDEQSRHASRSWEGPTPVGVSRDSRLEQP